MKNALVVCLALAVTFLVASALSDDDETEHLVASEGTEVAIPCNVSSNAAAVGTSFIIVWKNPRNEVILSTYLNSGGPIVESTYKSRLFLIGPTTVLLRNLTEVDGGRYTCELINLQLLKDVQRSHINVTINTKPRFIDTSPARLNPTPDTMVSLVCRARGQPAPLISWFRNGERLTDGAGIRVSNDEVTLFSVQWNAGGNYVCLAANQLGTIRHSMAIILPGAAYILRGPENITAIAGRHVRFDCEAAGYPDKLHYDWFHQDEQLSTRDTAKYELHVNGSLVIKDVKAVDSGWYKCRPSNGARPSQTAIAFLDVQFVPEVVSVPAVIQLSRNLPGHISCPIRSNPPVQTVIWMKNGSILNTAVKKGLSVTSEGALAFDKVANEDSGVYRCQGQNSIGHGHPSSDIHVVVKDAPIFTLYPSPYYHRTVGESVTLPCGAISEPSPTISWKKKNGELPAARYKVEDGSLHLWNLKKEDHFTYSCIANNGIAAVSVDTDLVIYGTTPHTPRELEVVVGAFSVTLTWKPSFNGGTDQWFNVWYKRAGTDWKKTRVYPTHASRFTVYSLAPDTLYTFVVVPQNELGLGDASETMTVTTDKLTSIPTALPTDAAGATYFPLVLEPIGEAPMPPDNVTVRKKSDDSFIVTWNAPAASYVAPLYYVIELRERGNQWQQIEPPTVPPHYILSALRKNQEFYVRVRSFTVVSKSEPSAVATFRTDAPELTQSEALIAGVLGGVAFLVVFLLMACVIVKCVHKRKQKKKEAAYVQGKFLDSSQEDTGFRKGDELLAHDGKANGYLNVEQAHLGLENSAAYFYEDVDVFKTAGHTLPEESSLSLSVQEGAQTPLGRSYLTSSPDYTATPLLNIDDVSSVYPSSSSSTDRPPLIDTRWKRQGVYLGDASPSEIEKLRSRKSAHEINRLPSLKEPTVNRLQKSLQESIERLQKSSIPFDSMAMLRVTSPHQEPAIPPGSPLEPANPDHGEPSSEDSVSREKPISTIPLYLAKRFAEDGRVPSVDENYEFDSISGLESELLEALKNYNSFPTNSPRQSTVVIPEDRMGRLKQEFSDFRRKQREFGVVEDEESFWL